MKNLQTDRSLYWEGLWLGIKVGFCGAEVFILALCFMMDGPSILDRIVYFYAVFFYGQIYGTLPAIVIGAICGGLTGLTVQCFPRFASPLRTAVLGLAIVVVLFFVVIWSGLGMSIFGINEVDGVVWIIIAIALGSALWAGHQLGSDAQYYFTGA